jgi:hypothetical protein
MSVNVFIALATPLAWFLKTLHDGEFPGHLQGPQRCVEWSYC